MQPVWSNCRKPSGIQSYYAFSEDAECSKQNCLRVVFLNMRTTAKMWVY